MKKTPRISRREFFSAATAVTAGLSGIFVTGDSERERSSEEVQSKPNEQRGGFTRRPNFPTFKLGVLDKADENFNNDMKLVLASQGRWMFYDLIYGIDVIGGNEGIRPEERPRFLKGDYNISPIDGNIKSTINLHDCFSVSLLGEERNELVSGISHINLKTIFRDGKKVQFERDFNAWLNEFDRSVKNRRAIIAGSLCPVGHQEHIPNMIAQKRLIDTYRKRLMYLVDNIRSNSDNDPQVLGPKIGVPLDDGRDQSMYSTDVHIDTPRNAVYITRPDYGRSGTDDLFDVEDLDRRMKMWKENR